MERIVQRLRAAKIENEDFPTTLEITYIGPKKIKAQYSGLYLSSSPFRIMRPVINNKLDKVECIGAFEQVYLGICLKVEDQSKYFKHRYLVEPSFEELRKKINFFFPEKSITQLCSPISLPYFPFQSIIQLLEIFTLVKWLNKVWALFVTITVKEMIAVCTD